MVSRESHLILISNYYVSISLDQMLSLLLFRQPENRSGTQHLEFGAISAQVSHQVLNKDI